MVEKLVRKRDSIERITSTGASWVCRVLVMFAQLDVCEAVLVKVSSCRHVFRACAQ